MTEDDSHNGTLEVAASASNAPEADLICQRLADAGIHAMSQRSIGGPEWGVSGGRYVYVEAEDLARAREVLAAPVGISEEDLAALAEAAAPREAGDEPA
ncbi:MAG TPA: hypothetical protein VK790_07275 [Solirubrobacteraceae bacterium]|jgi:hypothetical protein|nr:hypothetical protein [Solirubrobacteraceae bacterium]